MRTTKYVALLAWALLPQHDARADAPTAVQLERTVFEFLLLSPDLEKSRLGTRMLAEQFANDASWCDIVAERTLQEPVVNSRVPVDTVAWYVRALRDRCPPRYHDVFTAARARYLHDKITEHLDVALKVPADASVAQYVAGGVDLEARRLDIDLQMAELQRAGGSGFGAAKLGMRLGEVLQRTGAPREFASLFVRIARWGNGEVLAAHFVGHGMLIFRREFKANQWRLADTLDELTPVSDAHRGEKFAIAQSVACMRGLAFRDYVRMHIKVISADRDLMWALTHRLSHTPFPADDHEEAGMIQGVVFMYRSQDEQSLDMLREVAASPGDEVPKIARKYLEAREKNAVKAPAEAK